MLAALQVASSGVDVVGGSQGQVALAGDAGVDGHGLVNRDDGSLPLNQELLTPVFIGLEALLMRKTDYFRLS